MLLVVPPSDLFLVRTASPPSCSLVATSQVYTCSVAAPVSRSALALVQAPLQCRVDLCSLFCGSTFCMHQPSRRGIELSLALSQWRPDYRPNEWDSGRVVMGGQRDLLPSKTSRTFVQSFGRSAFFRTCSQVFSTSLVSPLFRLILCVIFLSSVSLVFIVRSPTIAYVSAGTRVRRVTWV